MRFKVSQNYFWIFLVFFPFLVQGAESGLFFQQIQQFTDQATHKREGLVIWTNLENQQQKIFGNSKLAGEKFLPGSLFKLVTAQAAVENQQILSYRCNGHDVLGFKRRTCWTRKGHGLLELPQALGISCNLYFQNLGLKLGFDKIWQVLRQYPNLSNDLDPKRLPPGLDLARFAMGDEASYRLTPQELDTFWNLYVIKIQDKRYAAIYQGLRRSVYSGTASKLKKNPLEILAKTGTGDSLNSLYKTHGWFLGAIPAQNPQYSVLIFLQEAHGFEEPTKLAEKIFSKAYEFGVEEAGKPL